MQCSDALVRLRAPDASGPRSPLSRFGATARTANLPEGGLRWARKEGRVRLVEVLDQGRGLLEHVG